MVDLFVHGVTVLANCFSDVQEWRRDAGQKMVSEADEERDEGVGEGGGGGGAGAE